MKMNISWKTFLYPIIKYWFVKPLISSKNNHQKWVFSLLNKCRTQSNYWLIFYVYKNNIHAYHSNLNFQ
jgi:hypothetical protein